MASTPDTVAPGTVTRVKTTKFLEITDLPSSLQYYNKIKQTDIMTQVKNNHLEIQQTAGQDSRTLEWTFKTSNALIDGTQSYLELVGQINAARPTDEPAAGEQVVLQYGFPLSAIETFEINMSETNQTITNNENLWGIHRTLDHLIGRSWMENTPEFYESSMKAGGLERLNGNIFTEGLGRLSLGSHTTPQGTKTVVRDFWSTDGSKKKMFIYRIYLPYLHPVFNSIIPTTRISIKISFSIENSRFWHRLSDATSAKADNKVVPGNFRIDWINGLNKIVMVKHQMLASISNALRDQRNTTTGLPLATEVANSTIIQCPAGAGTIMADIVPIDSVIPPWFLFYFVETAQMNSNDVGHSPFSTHRNNVSRIYYEYQVPAWNYDYLEYGKKDNYIGYALTWPFKSAIEELMNEGKIKRSDFKYLTEVASVLDKDEKLCIWCVRLSPIMKNNTSTDPIGGNWQGSAQIRIEHGTGGATKAGAYYIRRLYPSTARFTGQTGFQDDRTLNEFKSDINPPK